MTRGPAGPLFVTRTGARWRPDNAAQCDALTAAECDRVFIDHGASGKLARRPELDAALGTSKPLAPAAREPEHRSVSGVERTAVRSGTPSTTSCHSASPVGRLLDLQEQSDIFTAYSSGWAVAGAGRTRAGPGDLGSSI